VDYLVEFHSISRKIISLKRLFRRIFTLSVKKQ